MCGMSCLTSSGMGGVVLGASLRATSNRRSGPDCREELDCPEEAGLSIQMFPLSIQLN